MNRLDWLWMGLAAVIAADGIPLMLTGQVAFGISSIGWGVAMAGARVTILMQRRQITEHVETIDRLLQQRQSA